MNVCDKVFLGEMVTTGPSSGIMSLPRGVRTSSIGNLLILFFRSADMCVAPSHYLFSLTLTVSLAVFVVILCLFLELTHHLTKSFPPAPAPIETEKSPFPQNIQGCY